MPYSTLSLASLLLLGGCLSSSKNVGDVPGETDRGTAGDTDEHATADETTDGEPAGDDAANRPGGAACEATPICQLAEQQWCTCCEFMCQESHICAGGLVRDDDPTRPASCEMVAQTPCDDLMFWSEVETCAVASGSGPRG